MYELHVWDSLYYLLGIEYIKVLVIISIGIEAPEDFEEVC